MSSDHHPEGGTSSSSLSGMGAMSSLKSEAQLSEPSKKKKRLKTMSWFLILTHHDGFLVFSATSVPMEAIKEQQLSSGFPTDPELSFEPSETVYSYRDSERDDGSYRDGSSTPDLGRDVTLEMPEISAEQRAIIQEEFELALREFQLASARAHDGVVLSYRPGLTPVSSVPDDDDDFSLRKEKKKRSPRQHWQKLQKGRKKAVAGESPKGRWKKIQGKLPDVLQGTSFAPPGTPGGSKDKSTTLFKSPRDRWQTAKDWANAKGASKSPSSKSPTLLAASKNSPTPAGSRSVSPIMVSPKSSKDKLQSAVKKVGTFTPKMKPTSSPASRSVSPTASPKSSPKSSKQKLQRAARKAAAEGKAKERVTPKKGSKKKSPITSPGAMKPEPDAELLPAEAAGEEGAAVVEVLESTFIEYTVAELRERFVNELQRLQTEEELKKIQNDFWGEMRKHVDTHADWDLKIDMERKELYSGKDQTWWTPEDETKWGTLVDELKELGEDPY